MDGKVVRLKQGDFKQKTIYSKNPVEIAKSYKDAGATWLHVIDLDGAKTGRSQNLSVIKQIKQETSLKIQVGGGIRSEQSIKVLLELGVDRVIVGTLAVLDAALLQELVAKYPGQVIVSVDSKDGFVTYSGWQDTTLIPTLGFCLKLERIGIDTIVYTDIAKDGMMEGPNIEDYKMLSKSTNLNIIASGGVSTIDDVKTLNDMNLYGAIIGKALYLKQIDLKEAILCSQDESSPV
jgi:phosphoribosylformimino-5-aminoimidazole carboxamide ribotide isomerase